MFAALIAVGSLVLYVVAYNTYGRWLARKVFKLDRFAKTPARELNDRVDYVPSRRDIVFGHHFTSIAGTGPIVGPAIAVIWGWLPALIWVLLGSIFMGAVHDFGALVLSLRKRGVSIGDLTGEVVCPRARMLFLAVMFFELLILVAVFALVVAAIFNFYPQSVLAVWLEIPIALVLGAVLMRRGRRRTVNTTAIIAVGVMYVTVALGIYLPIKLGTIAGFPATFWWMIALLTYAFAASVLPVQVLLQPRDFLNSHQLFIAMGLLFAGVLVAAPTIVAPAVNDHFTGADDYPFFPFLFITVACGAISGFHALVGSGTSSKQLARETDARFVGYGSMLMESMLSVLVILAVAAGIGMKYSSVFRFPGPALAQATRPDAKARAFVIRSAREPGKAGPLEAEAPEFTRLPGGVRATLKRMAAFQARNPGTPVERVDLEDGGVEFVGALDGQGAWREHYHSWADASGLEPKLGAFVQGSANMMEACGVPLVLGLAIMGVFVASFAGTSLDTATRLQRYVVSEFGKTVGVKALKNRYVATAVAVGAAALLTLWDGKGAGAMLLWPLFGGLNQLMASMALLVIAVYLYRRRSPTWVVTLPFVFMFAMTAWAMALNVRDYYNKGTWGLLAITVITLFLQAWMVVEAAIIWLRIRRERRLEASGVMSDE